MRFLVGQTSTNDLYLLYDAEIDFLLTQSPNPYWAAAQAADSLGALYKTAATEKRVGSLSLSYSNRSKDFLTLAANLRQQAVTRSASLFLGGQSHAAATAEATNPDQVLPNFTIGMDDNPLAPYPNIGPTT